MDDTRLIAQIANGDKAAIQAIFARYHTRLYRFIERIVGDAAMAEELANEVFLEIWRGAGRFEGRSKVSTWIMGIAHNKAVSALRKRREKSLEDDEAELIADGADNPELSMQKMDKAEALRLAIDQLSPDHKAVIDLVYYHELSISEAADVLKIPANTVKTRVFHARKNLAHRLEQSGIDRGWP